MENKRILYNSAEIQMSLRGQASVTDIWKGNWECQWMGTIRKNNSHWTAAIVIVNNCYEKKII